MPRKRNELSWKTQYSEHDYRTGSENRRVSFKHNKNRKDRDWASSIRAHLQDEDVDMGSSSTSSGFTKKFGKKFKGGRSDSPAPFHKRRFMAGPVEWFRVLMPFGNKYEKEFVARILLDHIQPLPLWPFMWTASGNSVTFYVDDLKVAEKLFNLDRQIQMPDGFKLIIRVSSGFPPVEINIDIKEKMKLAMAKRYTEQTKALDLTKFHADPELQNVFCALCKPVLLLTVIDIIADIIPQLEAINLFDNKIVSLSHLSKLREKLPQLKILHIGNNKIKDMSSLDPLIGLPIVDLVLNGNPLCSKFKDQETYVSEVRKRFPKVLKLDGIDLPPPIRFDIEEDKPLPKPRQTFLCHTEGEGIIRQFLEQYYEIFDNGNRQTLLSAYHENAVFSLTMSYPYGQKDKSTSWLSWYSSTNRNLLSVTDSERRLKLLKQGQFSVVSYLVEMPKTKHDIQNFVVDLNIYAPQMISVSIGGLFKEIGSGHKVPPMRYFLKNLVIIPAGTGFCIVNETLHITNATEEQIKFSYKNPSVNPINVISSPMSASSTGEPTTVVTSPLIVANQTIPDDLIKRQLVQTLSDQSGMNLEWSEKCLADSQWDFQRAITVFVELNKQGIVPPEAFKK